MSFEQRYQMMQTKAQAAANAKISASQAVSLVQKQAPNARIMGVQYHDGSNRPMKNVNAQNAQATDATNKIIGYRVMTMSADGKPQLYIVDANNGQVTQKDMQKWGNKPNHPQNNQPKALPATSVSLAQAMQLAANKVGGEAVGAHFGGHHGKHGEHDNHGAKPQNGAPEQAPKQATDDKQPKTPSYRVEVVKGQEIYMVKVNAQTGEVSQAVSMKDMQNRMNKTQPAS